MWALWRGVKRQQFNSMQILEQLDHERGGRGCIWGWGAGQTVWYEKMLVLVAFFFNVAGCLKFLTCHL